MYISFKRRVKCETTDRILGWIDNSFEDAAEIKSNSYSSYVNTIVICYFLYFRLYKISVMILSV